MKIFKYTTEEEAAVIIAEQEALGLALTDVQNVDEGNFLGFDGAHVEPKTPIEETLGEMQTTIDLILLKQEGIVA